MQDLLSEQVIDGSETKVLVLYKDHGSRQKLEKQYIEYSDMMTQSNSPQQQLVTFCKFYMLHRLLRDGYVNVREIADRIRGFSGSHFSKEIVNIAYTNVINDYCRVKSVDPPEMLGRASVLVG